jgi:uncharacterized protein (DUF849 family)
MKDRIVPAMKAAGERFVDDLRSGELGGAVVIQLVQISLAAVGPMYQCLVAYPNARIDAVIEMVKEMETSIEKKSETPERAKALETVRKTREEVERRCRKPRGNGFDLFNSMVAFSAAESFGDEELDYEDANKLGMAVGAALGVAGMVLVSPVGVVRRIKRLIN